MSEELTELLVKKLGLQDEPRILSKTTELLRLLDIKSSTIVSNIGDYAKTVISIDLAAASLGIPFENVEDALKICGLRKNAYQNYKRTFEKLLDINKSVSINDICIQLGLNEITQKANTLLDIYKKSVNDKENNIDTSHPQYATMAVYQACKLRKIKVSKTKLLPYSHLKPSQWARLEEQWEKILKKVEKKDLENLLTTKKQNFDANSPTKNCNVNENQNNSQNLKLKKNDVTEDYETWKIRILTEAVKNYKESKNLDTTNFVLPSIEEIRKMLSPKKIKSERVIHMDESC